MEVQELITDSAAHRNGGGPSSGRVVIEACTVEGRAVPVEFRVRLDTVEVACGRVVSAVFDRGELALWLARPGGDAEVDDVVLGVDRLIDIEGRVALSVCGAGVRRWALSPGDHAALLRAV